MDKKEHLVFNSHSSWKYEMFLYMHRYSKYLMCIPKAVQVWILILGALGGLKRASILNIKIVKNSSVKDSTDMETGVKKQRRGSLPPAGLADLDPGLWEQTKGQAESELEKARQYKVQEALLVAHNTSCFLTDTSLLAPCSILHSRAFLASMSTETPITWTYELANDHLGVKQKRNVVPAQSLQQWYHELALHSN